MIQQLAGPRPRLWTKEEYYRLGDLGFFDGQKVELWEGELMVQSPQNWPHYSTLDRVADALRRSFGNGFWVRSQAPVDLGQTTEPEPDISVIAGRREDYTAHPTTALLIVEISDTSLRTDRGPKGSLYACAGLADYWIVNLVDIPLEVYRDPRPDLSQLYGHGYASQPIFQDADFYRRSLPRTFVSPSPTFSGEPPP